MGLLCFLGFLDGTWCSLLSLLLEADLALSDTVHVEVYIPLVSCARDSVGPAIKGPLGCMPCIGRYFKPRND